MKQIMPEISLYNMIFIQYQKNSFASSKINIGIIFILRGSCENRGTRQPASIGRQVDHWGVLAVLISSAYKCKQNWTHQWDSLFQFPTHSASKTIKWLNFNEKYENTNYSTVIARRLAIFSNFNFIGSSEIYLLWTLDHMDSPEAIRVNNCPCTYRMSLFRYFWKIYFFQSQFNSLAPWKVLCSDWRRTPSEVHRNKSLELVLNNHIG